MENEVVFLYYNYLLTLKHCKRKAQAHSAQLIGTYHNQIQNISIKTTLLTSCPLLPVFVLTQASSTYFLTYSTKEGQSYVFCRSREGRHNLPPANYSYTPTAGIRQHIHTIYSNTKKANQKKKQHFDSSAYSTTLLSKTFSRLLRHPFVFSCG